MHFLLNIKIRLKQKLDSSGDNNTRIFKKCHFFRLDSFKLKKNRILNRLTASASFLLKQFNSFYMTTNFDGNRLTNISDKYP